MDLYLILQFFSASYEFPLLVLLTEGYVCLMILFIISKYYG